MDDIFENEEKGGKTERVVLGIDNAITMYGFSSIEKLSNLMVDAFLNEKDMKKLIQFKGLGCENYETNRK